jgi:hypothetical protein
MPDLAAQSGSLVRRARAGDQNAMALIREIGIAARDGVSKKAKAVHALIMKYIERNPAPKLEGPDKGGLFGFGGEAATGLPPAPQALVQVVGASSGARQGPKPELPRGAFDKLFDDDLFPVIVVKACQYRNGLAAAAVVLAAGPSLTAKRVQEIGASTFGSDEATAVFFHGVKFCTDADLREAGKVFDAYLRRPLVVGQCVGRAWRLQAVRRPGSRIASYAPVAAWEMGEDLGGVDRSFGGQS